jgi:hypothetical protein
MKNFFFSLSTVYSELSVCHKTESSMMCNRSQCSELQVYRKKLGHRDHDREFKFILSGKTTFFFIALRILVIGIRIK